MNFIETLKNIISPQNKFTEDTIERLKPFEEVFSTAVKGNYIRRLSPTDREKIYEIVNSAGYNYESCGKCNKTTLQDMRMFGKMYYQKIDELKIEKNDIENDGETKTTVSEIDRERQEPQSGSAKRGRPKGRSGKRSKTTNN